MKKIKVIESFVPFSGKSWLLTCPGVLITCFRQNTFKLMLNSFNVNLCHQLNFTEWFIHSLDTSVSNRALCICDDTRLLVNLSRFEESSKSWKVVCTYV